MVVDNSDEVKAGVEVGTFVVVGDSDGVISAGVVGTLLVVDNSSEVKVGVEVGTVVVVGDSDVYRAVVVSVVVAVPVSLIVDAFSLFKFCIIFPIPCKIFIFSFNSVICR